MTSLGRLARSLVLAAACAALPRDARSEPPTLPPYAIPAPDALEPYLEIIREYEIRLGAHRRELLAREAELDATKRALADLRRKTMARSDPAVAPADDRSKELERSERQARAEANRLREKVQTLEKELQKVASAKEEPQPPPSTEVDKALVASLQHELDVERANRATLESEIRRLVSESRSGEEVKGLTQSLDAARAEILLLNQRLATEQRVRESLEVAVERMRRAAQMDPGEDWMERFATNMKERREQAERLQEELHRANEIIVGLKGKLEAVDDRKTNPGDPGLEGEVKRLRDALHSAEQANADLRTQAELASRLAEMLYGNSR